MALIWPPDFKGELARRKRVWEAGYASEDFAEVARKAYAADPVMFINDCVFVYEPRNASRGDPTKIPAVPFQRQAEFIYWLKTMFENKWSGPVEKSRDSGATWMASAFAVWVWLFIPGSSIGFGSRKEALIDRKGDMGAIFPKIRAIIDHLPIWLVPEGYNPREHDNYLRIINPDNVSSIVGEAGDAIGRGGRTSLYFVDESAHIEHPETIDASLTANTDVRIDISSAWTGTVFDRWCAASPPEKKFIFDLHDVPWHTEEWVKTKKDELESKGLGHIYRREYLRDGTAGIAGQLIPSDWVEASVGAADKLRARGLLPEKRYGKRGAGLDVADGGMDRNALCMTHGIEVVYLKSRPDLLADGAGAWAYFEAMGHEANELRYDSIGVGAGAAATLRNKKGVKKIIGFAGSDGVAFPDRKYEGNRTHGDMFANAKAQAWWLLRDRFLETYKLIGTGKYLGMETVPAETLDAIISLSPDLDEIRELKSELSQVIYKHNPSGKVLIDKKPDGQPSPNRADSVMIVYAPEQPVPGVIGVFN